MDLFTDGSAVASVAIDPAAGNIYWTNNTSGTIEVGPITWGQGTASDHALFTGQTHAEGIAVDPADGKIYWSDNSGIMVGNLNGEAVANHAASPRAGSARHRS